MKDNFYRFNIILFNTLTPFGTVGATSGAHDLVGILTFGASACLGEIYGGNKFLVLESSSSSHVGGSVAGYRWLHFL